MTSVARLLEQLGHDPDVLLEVLAEALAKRISERQAQPVVGPMTRGQVCDYLGVSMATEARLRKRGLPVVYCGDSPRYYRDAVDSWARAQAAPATETEGRS